MPWARVRANFGDAPHFLAHGITTVINLRGSPEQLEWRRRIEAGDLIGPTIYTSGEFVNEPRVNTPDEVAREVEAQRSAGYDLIKFHEAWVPGVGFTTTTGLSPAAYQRLRGSARDAGLPLVGHAPVNLGLTALLEAGQPLAHVGMLANIYFLPVGASRRWLALTVGAMTVLLVLLVTSRRIPSLRRPLATQLLAFLAAGGVALLFMPGGPLFDSLALRLVFTALAAVIVVAAGRLVIAAVTTFRRVPAARRERVHAAAAACAGAALAIAMVLFWLPVAWRSSDSGIDRLARRIHAAGIPVQTTLVVYESLAGPPGFRYADFMKKVTGALHRAGVSLVAGTDANGMPRLAPGPSLHRELELLIESGLSVPDALRAATVAPAQLLGKQHEFGTIAIGHRADLLLLDANPLEDVSRLRNPAGVMARGRWFTREQLHRMVAALGDN